MILAIVILALCLWIRSSSSAKVTLIKELSKSEIVKNIVGEQIKEDFSNNVLDADFRLEDIVIPEEVGERLTGYKNVALFGIDAMDQAFDYNTRSDTIMIISINNDSGAIRMVSVYRDTYLNIIKPNGENFYGKVNAAYSVGGPQSAVSTLNTNLDLNIDDYIVVNFDGLAEIIDLMDGVEINISEKERQCINELGLYTFGSTYSILEDSGLVHLDGRQATTYCRIRDIVFIDAEGNEFRDDFGRTARQRYVMQELVEKAKALGISAQLSLAKQVLNLNTEEKTFVKTSLEYDEIMDFVPVVIDYNIEASIGFPFTKRGAMVEGASIVVAEGLDCNVSVLHEFLFNDKDYVPSESVHIADSYIINKTGVQPCIPMLDEIENDYH